MWPLSGAELLRACGGECTNENLEKILVQGAVTDSRKVLKDMLFVAIKGEKFDGHSFVASSLKSGASLALVDRNWKGISEISPDQKSRCIIVEDVLESFRRFSKYFRQRFSFPVVGIGGSNGKTTTKEMLFALLGGDHYRVTKTEKSQNGYLGIPLTLVSQEHNVESPPHALVLEIGIDEKGAMEKHVDLSTPDTVLLTALGPEHIEGFGNWQTAVEEELKLFFNNYKSHRVWQSSEDKLSVHLDKVRSGDTVVVECADLDECSEFLVVKKICEKNRDKSDDINFLVYKIEKNDATSSRITAMWMEAKNKGGVPEHFSVQLQMPGKHNAQNFALASAAALSLGRTTREIIKGWESFTAPEMRSQIKTLKNGAILYNDCYNASPSSVVAALQTLKSPEWKKKKKLVILGDMLELGTESKKWHESLASELIQIERMDLCLYGNAMYDLFQELAKNFSDKKLNVRHLPKVNDPREFLSNPPDSETVILVKGSRSMDLGRVVERVTELI